MQQKKTKTAKRSSVSGKKRVPSGKAKQRAASKRPTLTYRDRVPADDAYILQLTEDQLATIHQQSFGEPFPREQFMTVIQSGAPVMLIEYGGKPIGYYAYLVGPDAKMHISAMVIEKRYQSKGIGTQVMNRVEQDASARGVRVIEVFVQANNEQSLAFTRQLGFVEVYRVPPNTICFQKQLAAQNTVPAGQTIR